MREFFKRSALACLGCLALTVTGIAADQRADSGSARWRFYAVEMPEGELPRELVVSQLWAKAPTTIAELQSTRDKRLLLGIERDATPANAKVADFSFTMSTGMIISGGGARMSPHGTPFFPYGVCFASSQAVTVWDGVIRWNWEDGVYIEPPTGETGPIFGFKDAKPTPFLKPLIAPVLRGREIELQVVVKDNKPKLVRNLFVLEKGRVGDLELPVCTPNADGRAEFKSRFTDVTDSEKRSPEIAVTVSAGGTAKKDISFDHRETLMSSFMRCASRHNAPEFLDFGVSFDGWEKTTVKLSLEVKAGSAAPAGNHYFRLIHRAEWDKGTIYRERVVLVSIK
jgi:hypothetical protein